MDRPFDDLRNRQQAIARRRKKKKFSLLLSQITVPSPHYNNDVDIRSNTKMMKYVIYSTGKDLFCYCVCVCEVCLFGCVCAYLVLIKLKIVMHHLLIPYLMHFIIFIIYSTNINSPLSLLRPHIHQTNDNDTDI